MRAVSDSNRNQLLGLPGLMVLLQILVAIGLPGHYLGLSPFRSSLVGQSCCVGHTCQSFDLSLHGSGCCCAPVSTPSLRIRPPAPPEDLDPLELETFRQAWEGVQPCRGSLLEGPVSPEGSPMGFAGRTCRGDPLDDGSPVRKTFKPWLLLAQLPFEIPAGPSWVSSGCEGVPCARPFLPAPVPIA